MYPLRHDGFSIMELSASWLRVPRISTPRNQAAAASILITRPQKSHLCQRIYSLVQTVTAPMRIAMPLIDVRDSGEESLRVGENGKRMCLSVRRM